MAARALAPAVAEVGVGLIGFGLAGRAFHAPYINAVPGLSLRTVVSSRADAVRAALPGVVVAPDVATLLADPAIGLVVVCSPDDLHADHALAALRAGKHVVVDKPFATSLADARRLADAAVVAGRLLSVFHNRRWDADFLTLRRLIDAGELGRVAVVESRLDRWRPVPAPTWKEGRRGGVWFDLGPHLVDQAVQLFGMPAHVDAQLATLRAGSPAPDFFHVVLGYPERRVILQSSKLAADHALRFAVHGDRASWVKHGTDPQESATLTGAAPAGAEWGLDPVEGVLTLADGVRRTVPNERGDYRRFWSALVDALRGEAPVPVPAAEAIEVMTVLDAGLRSAATHRRVAVQPAA